MPPPRLFAPPLPLRYLTLDVQRHILGPRFDRSDPEMPGRSFKAGIQNEIAGLRTSSKESSCTSMRPGSSPILRFSQAIGWKHSRVTAKGNTASGSMIDTGSASYGAKATHAKLRLPTIIRSKTWQKQSNIGSRSIRDRF